MTTQFKALPRLAYHIHADDPASDKPQSEQKRLKVLAALDHMCGLANLLRFIDLETDDPEGDRLADALHVVGELQSALADSIFFNLDVTGPASE